MMVIFYQVTGKYLPPELAAVKYFFLSRDSPALVSARNRQNGLLSRQHNDDTPPETGFSSLYKERGILRCDDGEWKTLILPALTLWHDRCSIPDGPIHGGNRMKRRTATTTRIARLTSIAAGMAIMILAASPAQAQHRVRMPASQAKVELPAGKDSVRLPLKAAADHIVLEISINGSEPLSVVLDTGMPMGGLALFETEEVKALNLEYSPMQATVGGAGGDGKQIQAKIANGVDVNLGGVIFSDLQTLVLPAMKHFSMKHAGIIGAAVFNNFAVTFDYDAGELILTRPEAYTPPAKASVVALDLKGNLPYVKAVTATGSGDETAINLVLDLGAAHNVSLNNSQNSDLSVPGGAIPTHIGRGLSGPMRGEIARISSFTLGGNTLKGVVATFPEAEHENPRGIDSLDGNLGIGLMSRFNFTLDYATKKMYLAPNKSFANPFEWNMSGLTLEPEDTVGLAVTEIVPGSPGAAAGLKEGDVVLSLNGEEVSGADRERVRDILRKEGQEVAVRYRRGDVTESAQLKLRRLI
jgi:hypothetical protein